MRKLAFGSGCLLFALRLILRLAVSLCVRERGQDEDRSHELRSRGSFSGEGAGAVLETRGGHRPDK